MKTISLRAFARQAPTLDETVLVVHQTQVIGRFIPVALDEAATTSPGPRIPIERTVTPSMGGTSFGASKPAPKPGKKS